MRNQLDRALETPILNEISEKKYQTTTITTNDDLRDNPDSINQTEVLLIPQLLVSRIRFCQCH